MAYLCLVASILLGTLFVLGYKLAAHKQCELRAVHLWMCLTATAVLVVTFALDGHRVNHTAVQLGALNGVFTYFSTLSFFYHMRKARLAVSWTVIGLAVAFPVAASIVFWHEHPSAKQWIGLALLPVALFLSAPTREARK